MNIERITGTFRALRSRNYRLFFVGQGISLIGTWMQQVAVSWLVYRLTGSAFLLGIVGFFSQLPSLFLFPIAGLLADRLDKRRLLILTQAFSLLQALILAVLVLSGAAAVWHIIVFTVMLGIINAFDMPARQAFVIEMVDRREDLGNAIALNSTLFNAARLIGPTIAGILISLVGEGLCLMINAVSFIPVIAALSGISVLKKELPGRRGNPLKEFLAGIKYAFGFPPIRYIILLLGVVSFAGMPFSVLLPVFAKTVLHGDAHTLGLLTGSTGLGAILGALYLASRKSVFGLERIIAIFAASFGISLCLFSLSRVLPFSLLMLILTGIAMTTFMASSHTVVQTILEDSMRGRVMAFYNVAFIGITPFGSLAAGSLAEKLGPTAAVLAGGCITIAGAVVFALNLPRIRNLVRPIYIQKGMLPKIAGGTEKMPTHSSAAEGMK